jgi:hypothetical protein
MPKKQFNLDFRPETYWPRVKPKAGRRREYSSPYAVYGDEFLPKPLDREVEIARVSLDSTTGDITSIRARPTKRGIKYRVLSEYEGDWKTTTSRKSSKKPLTFRQIVELIENMKLVIHDDEFLPAAPSDHRDRCEPLPGDAEDYVTFVEVSSGFYPELTT